MKKTHLIIHHSLTKDGDTVSWRAIRRYHVNTNGWSDIGYHWGVEKVDDPNGPATFETLLGRVPDQKGAHTKELGMNRKGLGICLVGNFDTQLVPPEQLEAAARLCKWLLDLFDIPVANVLGHREVGLLAGMNWKRGEYKTCPGRAFDMDRFRARLT